MSFMQTQVLHGDWWEVETKEGTVILPVEFFPTKESVKEAHPDAYSITIHLDKWGARLSAPGYLDCTDWTLHETDTDALEYLEEVYGD